jgi:carbon starvation protein
VDLWYHFAIMFEALFILTTIDAGTRVGRYLVQDLLGNLWKPLGETKNTGASVLASALLVAGWGYFLIQGVRDPLGGVYSLWPLFGIANQMLAAIGLCLGTTIILKMELQAGARDEGRGAKDGRANVPASPNLVGGRSESGLSGTLTLPTRFMKSSGRPALALVTLVPLVWLLAVTMTAGVQKILHPDARIGFLAQAEQIKQQLPSLEHAHAVALHDFVLASIQHGYSSPEAAALNIKSDETWAVIAKQRAMQFNNRLDAVVAATFLVLVSSILLLSVREWVLLLGGRKVAMLRETEPVWLPEYAVAESRPFHLAGLAALALALTKELSGEAEMERLAQIPNEGGRASSRALTCDDVWAREDARPPESPGCAAHAAKRNAGVYLEVTERRFKGVKQCC